MTDGGWNQNSKGKWVLSTSHGTIKPEEAFYVDPKFTKIEQTKGLRFKELQKKLKKEYLLQKVKKKQKVKRKNLK